MGCDEFDMVINVGALKDKKYDYVRDAFNGGFAVALAEGLEVDAALKFANCVGALSTTRQGTSPAMPRRQEIVTCLAQNHGIML